MFTDPFVVINALKTLYESSPRHSIDLNDSEFAAKFESSTILNELNRRISGAGLFKLPSINEEHDSLSYKRESDEDEGISKLNFFLNYF